MPLFSASHVSKWDAVSSLPGTSSSPPPTQLSQDSDHEWHWDPSKWPLLQRASNDGTTNTSAGDNGNSNEHEPLSSTARTKMLLLSSGWSRSVRGVRPRASSWRSHEVWSGIPTEAEEDDEGASEDADARPDSSNAQEVTERRSEVMPASSWWRWQCSLREQGCADRDGRAGYDDGHVGRCNDHSESGCYGCGCTLFQPPNGKWSRDRGSSNRKRADQDRSSANGNADVKCLSHTFVHDSWKRKKESRMAVKTHTWISLWFLITIPVIFWDASYCLMRPRSMEGGDLHWIWPGYEIYQNVDYVYGLESFQRNDGFPSAQASLNLIENVLNIIYIYYAHFSPSSVAPLIGFAGALMTLSKTVLYWAQEYFCGFCATGHNDLATWLVYWILPNGLWILFPGMVVYTLGKDIAATLAVAERGAVKTALGKKN
ncbi:hypothetical protein ID866_4231 [Astraeus odoratus]|nr:hypothetical protein ID866_4231 [Astraeus odoratus]